DLNTLEIDLLLVEWNGVKAVTGGVNTDAILQHASCDVVLLHGNRWQQTGSVFLALRGGPNISLGMRVARGLAREDKITLFHAVDNPRATPDMKPLLKADGRISRTVTGKSGALEGIMGEWGGHKVIILGATFHPEQAEASASAALIEPLQE